MLAADPLYPLFSIASFLGFICSLVPLAWHLEAWNSGTCYYMIWAALACLNQFINSVLFANDAINKVPVWCDISIRLTLGASVGIPAASLCIVRRLHSITKVQTLAITRAEKCRAVLIDSLICVLLPMIVMALAFIVQGHRFDIYEELGCFPPLYNSVPTFFLVYSWPLILGLISAVYCALTIRSFVQRQVQFNQFINSNNSSLTISRYFRLMALAGVEMLCTIPIAICVIYFGLTSQPLNPWISFAETHYNFSRVGQIPSVIWRQNPQLIVSFNLSRWVNPACAFVFFIFFGFAAEARKNYRSAFFAILTRCRLIKATSATSNSSSSGLRILALPSTKSEATLSSCPSSKPPHSKWPKHSPQSSSSSSSDSLDEKPLGRAVSITSSALP